LLSGSAAGHSPNPFPAYALVLGVEFVVALGALLLLDRVNVHQFREDTGRSLDQVLVAESL
jgi:BCD family chlorophyll transporter-like MFS transporter